MIRQATDTDLPVIAAMGPAFWAENRMPGTFKPEVWLKSWRFILGQGLGTILVAEEGGVITGCLGATVTPDLNTGDLVATEAFWWVQPQHRGHGVRLLIEFECWAMNRGAARCGMAHVQANGKTLDRLYRRRGFAPMDSVYVKHLKEN